MDINEDYKLVLLNDEVNSFSYIMACLIRFCGYDPGQAEQCALIADSVGRCAIKHGSYFDMIDIQGRLSGLNIKTKVENNESNMH